MDLMDRLMYGSLAFVPLSIVAAYLGAPSLVVFLLAIIAIIPLSKLIGDATEELSTYTGPAVGGLLNATFGNAPELIIAGFALHAGLIELVKATIAGSILSNLLLGLGLAALFGGIRHKHQKFNARAAKASSATLLLAVTALIIPALFVVTSSAVSIPIIQNLSLIVSVFLIIAYAASLVFSLWTHQHLYVSEAAAYIPRWKRSTSVIILLIATLAVAWVSDVLVGAITPAVTYLGWSQIFIGITILAVIGNIAEHVTAIRVAMKDNMDLAFQIAIGSATQVAMFVAPVLVIASMFFAVHMTLIFGTFELAALVLSVLIVNTIAADGDSNWFEGLLLIIAYAIVGAAFFLYR